VAIRSIGKLANTATYTYTDEQAAKVVDALQAEVDKVAAQFEAGEADSAAVGFEL
jgi:hypothetical protein